MDAERALVSKLAQTGEVETVISRGISEAHFADDSRGDPKNPTNLEVYEWIVDHVRQYQTAPSMQAIKEKFKHYEFEISTDSLDFLIDRFITNVKRRMAKEMLLELGDTADDYDQGKDIDIHFLDAARQLATIVPTTKVARFSDMSKRIEQYHVDKEEGNVWGIKMGIPYFDTLTFGIQPHELLVCAGWQGTGKSTLMQFIAFNAYLQGKTVLFISLEMEHHALLRKFDTMAVDMNYRELKGLELGEDALQRWVEWSERAKDDTKDIIIMDRIGSRTATGIYAETVRHKPDLVVVDYISLLDAPRSAGSEGWQKIGSISRELKLNAQTLGIPMIAAAQTNRDSKKEGVKLETIAFSSSIGMDADMVIGLNQDEDQKEEKKMEVILVKNRDGAGGRVLMNWDMSTMQFGERTEADAFTKNKRTPPPETQEDPKRPEPDETRQVSDDDNPFRKKKK